jgi:hypothetical protein
MLVLLAYAPDERWAFVREGDRVLLVRPPFQQDVVASEAEVERAVTILGFIADQRDFPARRALIDFLGDESVRAWQTRRAPKDVASLRSDLLATLTAADIDRQIERATRKIDAGKYDEGLTLLARLLTADALTRAQRDAIAARSEQAQRARSEQEEQRRLALRPLASTRFARAAAAVPPGGLGPPGSDTLHPAA